MSSKENEPMYIAHLASKFPIVNILMVGITASVARYYRVPTQDVLFSVLFSTYLLVANVLRFQSNALAQGDMNLTLLKEEVLPWFSVYIGVFATMGLLLPAATLLGGPPAVGAAAAPHLFLLLSQITMEGITNHVNFHNLIRILVPIGFNAYREKSLLAWVTVAWDEYTDSNSDSWWYQFGFGLAAVNLLLWTYNLFVFLLLRMTPYYLDPVESPAAPVVWKGQLIPVLCQKKD